jgi:hypothetical protein
MVSGVPRQTLLNIQGLITTPNEYGVYPEGAASRISNMLARAAHQWVMARDTTFFIQSGTGGHVIYRIFGVYPGVFVTITVDPATGYVSPWTIYFNNDSTTPFTTEPASLVTSTGLFNPSGYLTPQVFRSRIYLNSQKGVLVCDTTAPSSAPQRIFRTGGLVQPRFVNVTTVSGSVLPINAIATYCCVIRRVAADGYTQISPPSPPVRFWAHSGTPTQITWIFQWAFATDFRVGDVAELYRSAGIVDTVSTTDTGTSMRLVASKILTALETVNQRVDLTDTQPMSAPLYETAGAEIYTSPYQEGSTGANLPPPVCKSMAQWGTYTFYGNITEDPQVVIDVPGGIFDDGSGTTVGYDATMRKNGIGRRTVTGTTVIGSPTITGVSAADMVGIVPGQVTFTIVTTGFVNATILSVTASTITLNANCTVAGSHIVNFDDMLEINGVAERVDNGLSAGRPGAWLGGQAAIYGSETFLLQTQDPVVTKDVSYTIQGNRSGIYPTLSVRATNGANYSPPLPEISATARSITTTERPNLLRWSKSNQPEAVPTPNEAFIGNGKIIRMLATTDALIILCTDGAYRLSGEAGVWRSDLVDPSFVPCAPDACCVLNDIVYAYTMRGFCSLSGNQTSLLSRGVIDAQFPGRQFEEIRRIHLYANTTTEEIIVLFQDAVTLDASATVYVYSTLYKQWSQYDPSFDLFTAIGTFFPIASGGLPSVLFGEYGGSGFAPVVSNWAPDLGVPLNGELETQPLYAGDPATQKQWIDATYILDKADFFPQVQQYTTSSFSDFMGSGNSFAKDIGFADKRCTIGIRRASAIGPVLRLRADFMPYDPGTSPPMTLKGISIRFVPLTTQQRDRQ